LASVAQICLRTEKANRFESSLKLRIHLEELHNSFGMGTPENVVAAFFSDPQVMYQESKKSISRSIPVQNDTPEPEQKPRDLKDTQKIDEKELIAAHTESNKISKSQRSGNNNKHKVMLVSLSAAAVVVAALVVLIFK
jgi:hypothetical protein